MTMRWQDPEYACQMSEAHVGYAPTEEARRNMSAAATGREFSAETRQKISEKTRGRFKGEPAAGFAIHHGYRLLTGQQGHPLANVDGALAEHRKVLYDTIGPGPHLCHWGCGRLLLWGGGIEGIYADHLDRDKLHNEPENLVPSCWWCNWNRDNHTHPEVG